MANVLPLQKQIAVISALAEGNAIRSIERMTGIHRDTIMRLGVKVGEGCARVMSERMKELDCRVIQMDEIWGFIAKKQKNYASAADRRAGLGDVWTFVAIDAESKMVPTFLVGLRDGYHADAFVDDLAKRLTRRPQISTDGLRAYTDAVERGFGCEADYAQVVKTYGASELDDQRRYSPAKLTSIQKIVVSGSPDETLISTSYVERQNLTMRMHMRRLTRLTNAFSKKLENFKAAVGLYFAYYNFVRVHKSLRMTPAMAGGVTDHIWTVEELFEGCRMMDTGEGIKRAAERARGAPVRFVEATPIVETFRGEIVWEGAVSVFDSDRGKVYAWAVDGEREPEFVAVLNKSPVDSPLAAVRAWIVSQAKK